MLHCKTFDITRSVEVVSQLLRAAWKGLGLFLLPHPPSLPCDFSPRAHNTVATTPPITAVFQKGRRNGNGKKVCVC